jgi:cystathionine beta-lyase/cystathionine gamma-synthase
MGGAAIARADLIRLLRVDFGALGVALDPHAAFLIQRGLKTYFVRYSAQCARAMRIAKLLASHPAVARVHYPGLPDHPQHALAAAQMREFGTIVSADFAGGYAAGGCFAESLKLFALTSSLGSTESLVVAPQMMGGRDLTPEQLRASAVTEGTVRLSIGLEDEEDLVADVHQALDAARTRCG